MRFESGSDWIILWLKQAKHELSERSKIGGPRRRLISQVADYQPYWTLSARRRGLGLGPEHLNSRLSQQPSVLYSGQGKLEKVEEIELRMKTGLRD